VKRLSELKVGEPAVVTRVEGSCLVRRRLLSMGFVPGTEVRALRVAPMGDPVAFEVMGYCLSLRRDEAAQVLVEPVAVVPLTRAPTGQKLRVVALRGGWGMRRRLSAIGICEGAELVRVSSGTSGPVAVRVAGPGTRSELSDNSVMSPTSEVGHMMATHVLVTPI